MSVRVCIACRVWSEIRSRLEIASRLRFDLAGDLISSDPSRVRSGSTPIQSVRVPFSCSWGPVGGREAVLWAADPSGPDPMPPNPAHVHRSPPVHTAMVLVKTSEGGQSVQSSYRPTRARLKWRTRGSEPAGTDATRVALSHTAYDPRVANPREGSVHQRVGEPATHVQHERRGVSRARAVRALSHSPAPPHELTPPVSCPVGRSVCSHERLPRRAVGPRRAGQRISVASRRVVLRVVAGKGKACRLGRRAMLARARASRS